MSETEWDEVIDLAMANGCDPENPCWRDCLDVAFNIIERHP